MVERSNAKINLGLNITRKRSDGYHELESIFLPIPIYDEIHLEEASELSFNSEGIAIPGDSSSNLCLKAFELIKSKKDIPNVSIHLKKNIPIGAGLGGGSSNCAFVLKMLNTKFELGFLDIELEKLAMQLGSDCAFFVKNKPCYVTGRGEKLDFDLDLSLDVNMVLVNPGIHIGTKEAYSSIKPMPTSFNLKEIEKLSHNDWTKYIINDFEVPMIESYSELANLKRQLSNSGAFYVSMTGSGSSFFAMYTNQIPNLDFPKHYFVSQFRLTI